MTADTQPTAVPTRSALLTSSIDRGATTPALLETTIGDHFDAIAKRYPDHEALVSRHQGIRLTYRELQQKATQLACAMLRSVPTIVTSCPRVQSTARMAPVFRASSFSSWTSLCSRSSVSRRVSRRK